MLLQWLLLGCASDAGPQVDTTEPVAALEVEGGYGGGAIAVGGWLHVWAAVDPQASVVTGWTGDVELLERPAEWNTRARPPASPAVVTPVLAEVDAPVVARTVGGRRLLVVPADDPVGVVLFFHGAAYSVDELNDNAARTIVLSLHRAHYAVIALPSSAEVASGTGGWSSAAAATNDDLASVRALLAELEADGTAPGDLPRFAWGMSSGGMFAHLAGAELPTAGVAAWCAAGASSVLAQTTTPTAWYLAEHDSVMVSAVDDALRYRDALEARGIATDLWVHSATPLYDQRFERITGIDPVQSAQIARGLRDAGFVDDDDAFTTTGARITASLAEVDGVSELDALTRTAVAAEIEIMAADHELYDDAAARMVAFLDTVRTSGQHRAEQPVTP
ncbi:MAG: hypothetical protein KC621_30270 [Myxococcales bacterium]|nr:hypothetical protein [Myxococcales bacterium]